MLTETNGCCIGHLTKRDGQIIACLYRRPKTQHVPSPCPGTEANAVGGTIFDMAHTQITH